MNLPFSRSLKLDVLLKTGSLTFFAILLVVIFNFFSTKNLLLDNNKLVIFKQNQSIVERINEYITRVKEFHNVAVASFSNKNIEAASMLETLLHNVKEIDNLTRMTFYSTNGSLLCAEELQKTDKKDQVYAGQPVLPDYNFALISKNSTNAPTKIAFLDSKFSQIASVNSTDLKDFEEERNETSNNQQAEWKSFKFNKNTSDYEIRFNTLIKDSANTLKGKLVTGTSLGELSLFLNEIRASESTRLFVVDEQGIIIADSDMSGTTQGKLLKEIPDETVKKLFNKVDLLKINDKKDLNSVDVDSIGYYTLTTPFPKNSGTTWKVITTTQQIDFLEGFFEQQRYTLYVMFVGLILILILIYFQTTSISEPLSNVVLEAQKIENLELQDDFLTQSSVREISYMAQSMKQMKTTVKNLAKYIPKSLVLKFKEVGKETEIGGDSAKITLMFSDIASFSTISEKMEAKELANHLSVYFQEMTQIISANDGIIDKFIGDAIMCFWGAPEQDPEQEVKACRTTLLCKKRLDILNKYWLSIGKPPLATRFGIHTGICVVGNVGSEERMNYTALGDSVNLAARLEGSNKFYGTSIIISRDVKEKLPTNFVTRPIDIVAVKGKTKGVEVFELIGMDNDPDLPEIDDSFKEYIKEFSAMIEHYRNQNWHKAIELINKLNTSDWGNFDEFILSVYKARCTELLQNPPKADWDAVTHLTGK